MPAKAGIQVVAGGDAWIPPVEDWVILPRGGNDGGHYLAELQEISKRVAAYRKGSLIPNILQQPFRRNFPAQAFRFGQLVDLAGNSKKLRALDIAALGVRDLPI